jgi:hypothetical protein
MFTIKLTNFYLFYHRNIYGNINILKNVLTIGKEKYTKKNSKIKQKIFKEKIQYSNKNFL